MATAGSDSDPNLVRSLLRLSREISLAVFPSSLQRRNFASVARKARLLSLLFEELLRSGEGGPPPPLPRSAALCLKEILVVLQRFKALLGDCATRSRARLLLQSDAVAVSFNDLTLDLSSLLGILPLPDLDLSDDVRDLVELVRRQCRRAAFADPADDRLRAEILDMIRQIEQGIVPDRSRLVSIFDRLGLADSRACRDEIECLEREIGDRVAEKWTTAMVALVGLLRYAKCVIYGASTPRPETVDKAGSSSPTTADPAVPADFRCPISLDLMRDPVVVASGQTYDRDSITRWIASGHLTCPKTAQVLAHTDLIPNRALRNLIARWCRENNVPFDAKEDSNGGDPNPAGGNKAALEATRMTARFLVDKLAASSSPEVANRVVHELRQLAKTGSDNRAFVAEAGAIPLLLPLLSSDDRGLQVNAVTALLNLSILEANKKRIMHADGGVDGVVAVLSSGATWRAKENAAATVLSLSSVHVYRRRLARYPRVVESLVDLVRPGPTSTKKDALAAILSLAGDRENIDRLVESGAVEAALAVVAVADVADEAVAVLAAVAKRGRADAVARAEGSVKKLVAVLRRGSDWARESAVSALVLVCRNAGGDAVAELATIPGIECVIWDMMASGTERVRRKAASLGRICRRWLAAVEETASFAAMSSITASSTTATVQA